MTKYQVIYADPPWYETGAINPFRLDQHGAAHDHFLTMRTDEICGLPVRLACDVNCALFLWSTSRHIPDALRIVEAWGFRFVKIVFTWMKQHKSGKLAMGLGYYTRSNSEYVLLGIKGSMRPITFTVREALLAPRGRPFEKPREIRDRIVQMFGDVPRIELFARQKVKGWDSWGNEVESDLSWSSMGTEVEPGVRVL
jgi:N6-adenosine-specific RNA methylase IME4